jgi:hypothetical protein
MGYWITWAAGCLIGAVLLPSLGEMFGVILGPRLGSLLAAVVIGQLVGALPMFLTVVGTLTVDTIRAVDLGDLQSAWRRTGPRRRVRGNAAVSTAILSPPVMAMKLLAVLLSFLPQCHAESLAGDLLEEYENRCRSEGLAAAAHWYSNQVLRSVGPILWMILRRRV